MRSPLVLVTALYALLTAAFTWPLLTRLGSALPEGHGDPLLNCWILAWDAERLKGLLHGRLDDFLRIWQANIFFPEKDALAYSEHLLAQALPAFPIYVATGNVVVAYNLLFLSTFVLSGLGTFLLVRSLTGSAPAGLVAGVLYAFLPYRVDHLAHLQVLSCQWMPLCLFFLVRFFDHGRKRALVAAAIAGLAQNLSSGYYLLFFPPFLGLFVLFELHRRGRLADGRMWRALLLAAATVALLTAPFLVPYARVHERGEVRRERAEVEAFSADIRSYVSADENLRLWGPRLPGVDRNEVQLFPGLTPILLALASVLFAASSGEGTKPRLDLMTRCFLGAAAIAGVLALVVATGHPVGFSLGALDLRVHNGDRAFLVALLAAATALARSPELRGMAARVSRSQPAFFAVALALAVWLSFGPVVHDDGQPLPAFGLYRLFYDHVPGYDGLRVPARVSMLAGLFLAVLAGFGMAALVRRFGSRMLPAALVATFLVEAWAAPLPLWPAEDPGLEPSAEPAVYAAVRQLPAGSVLVELPFGDPFDEVKYVFYSTRHWRPLLNGYSGAFPASYRERRRALESLPDDPDRAFEALMSSPATHVVVHESFLHGKKGRRVTAWLEERGARRLNTYLTDVLFELPARSQGSSP